jgi:hypothetical protein
MDTQGNVAPLLIDLFAERVEDLGDDPSVQFSVTRLGDGQTNPDE